jgi:hypothetical protein
MIDWLMKVCSKMVADNVKRQKPLDSEVQYKFASTLYRLDMANMTMLKCLKLTIIMDRHNNHLSGF